MLDAFGVGGVQQDDRDDDEDDDDSGWANLVSPAEFVGRALPSGNAGLR